MLSQETQAIILVEVVIDYIVTAPQAMFNIVHVIELSYFQNLSV